MGDSALPVHAIRAATEADAPELARLLTALGHPRSAPAVTGLWTEWAAAGNTAWIAARPDGTLAGAATLHQMVVLHRPRPVGRITALVVDAAMRGQGIGRALVAAAEAALMASGCGLLEVTSRAAFVDAHTFYAHLGYEQTGLRFAKTLQPILDPVSGSGAGSAAARLRAVEEHVRRENAHDLTGIMETFADDMEYVDAPWGEKHAGRDAVQEYYRTLLTALPDLRIDVWERFVTTDTVVLEVGIAGTHDGTWRGLPATGRAVRFPLCAIYRFAADGRLRSETIYYDRAGLLQQIGLYHEPVGIFGRLVTFLAHPLTVARAYGRKVIRRPS